MAKQITPTPPLKEQAAIDFILCGDVRTNKC